MKRILSCLILITLFVSCDNNEDYSEKIYFVGDSMIDNWDLDFYFPNIITENLGHDGRSIDDISSISISNNSDIVLMIGVNDIDSHEYDMEEIKNYTIKYDRIVCSIGGNKIFLLSILPTRNMKRNFNIIQINKEIEKRLMVRDNIKYIDCYSSFLDKEGLLNVDLTREGLHLNDYGYDLLTNIVMSNL